MTNTFSIRDISLSGPVVWTEDVSPERQAEYVNSRAGMWFDPSGQGALLLSDEWVLDVWVGREAEDAEDTEPHHTFTHYDVAPLAELAREVVSDHDLLLRELMELVDETPGSLPAKMRAIMVEHINIFQD